jgi:hypothetical protein
MAGEVPMFFQGRSRSVPERVSGCNADGVVVAGSHALA